MVCQDINIEERDDGKIELVLRVLQYMCEGYNIELKSYLHHQPDNIRSVDLVAETVDCFATIIEQIHSKNIGLVVQTLETLVELAQGSLVSIITCQLKHQASFPINRSCSRHTSLIILITF